jgi:hypothetical protein
MHSFIQSSLRAGGRWVNRFDRGAAQNWQVRTPRTNAVFSLLSSYKYTLIHLYILQEVFDERGKYWWLMWMTPRTRRHSSRGVFWPVDGEKESVGGGVQQCPV